MSERRSIPMSHFVGVTSSSVRAGFTFNRLNGLVITESALVADELVEVLGLSDVARMYGTSSAEYDYAKVFFGYVSKTATSPERLTFWNWAPSGRKASLKGGRISVLAAIKKNGSFSLKVDGAATEVTVDLSAAFSFADAASKITAALEVVSAGMVCHYNDISGGLEIVSAQPGSKHSLDYALAGATGEDLSGSLCLTTATGATVSAGADASTLADTLNAISLDNGNYVSISCLSELSDHKEIGEWVKASQGRFIFVINSNDKEIAKPSSDALEALYGYDGLIVNYSPDNRVNALTQSFIASLDYSVSNGNTNMNFIAASEFADSAIGTASELEAVNANRCNTVYAVGGYGQSLPLYGEGKIMGDTFTSASVSFANTWLKAQLELAGVNIFIAIPLISLKGKNGASIVTAAMSSVINKAIMGGIIVRGSKLTALEEQKIISASNDMDAAKSVSENGYFLRVEPFTDEDLAVKRMRLLLIYAANIPANRIAIQNFIIGG